MIVACPSCQTRFQLDAAKLQPVGRHVRCAKCAHRWLQLPEGMEPPAGLMPPEPPEAEQGPPPAADQEPAPAADQIADQAPGQAAEPAAAAESPAAAPVAADSGAAAGKPAETPAEMAQSLAAIAEHVAAQTGQDGKAAAGQAAGPAQRLGVRMTGPIIVPPQMKPARPARRSSGLGFLLLAGIVIGILAAAYLFRDTIARVVPGADALYSLLGLSTDDPAADLEISIDKTEAQDENGKTFFSVTATIFNLSEYPVEIPPLVIVPVDEGGNQLEPIRFRLRERVAQPGQNIKFQKSFDNWPISAKSFILSVAEAP